MSRNDRVYFATNRAPGPDGLYDGRYADLSGVLFRVGECLVPEKRRWRDPNRSYGLSPDSLNTYEERMATLAEGSDEIRGTSAMFAEIQSRMRTEKRDLVVYIHGFANDFQSSLERGAQIRDWYGDSGRGFDDQRHINHKDQMLSLVMAWPTDGAVLGQTTSTIDSDNVPQWTYYSDRDDAEISGMFMARAFEAFIRFVTQSNRDDLCNRRIHIVAHSMGVYALRWGMQKLRTSSWMPRSAVFGNVFLMAGDEDADALERPEKLASLAEISEQVLVYHSQQDLPIKKSPIVTDLGPRIGLRGPRNMNSIPGNVISINCSRVSETVGNDDHHHQYYRSRPEVVRDVRMVFSGLLQDDIPGRRRIGDRQFIIDEDRAFNRRHRLTSGKG